MNGAAQLGHGHEQSKQGTRNKQKCTTNQINKDNMKDKGATIKNWVSPAWLEYFREWMLCVDCVGSFIFLQVKM